MVLKFFKFITAVISGILVSLLVFSIFYFLMSFCEVSLDISKWSKGARGMVGVLGGAASITFGGIMFYQQLKKS